MESLCKRFPHLSESILSQVNDQSLNRVKLISGDMLEYLDKERFFWIRIIKKYQNQYGSHLFKRFGGSIKIKNVDWPRRVSKMTQFELFRCFEWAITIWIKPTSTIGKKNLNCHTYALIFMVIFLKIFSLFMIFEQWYSKPSIVSRTSQNLGKPSLIKLQLKSWSNLLSQFHDFFKSVFPKLIPIQP